jgi:hypothetical protein
MGLNELINGSVTIFGQKVDRLDFLLSIIFASTMLALILRSLILVMLEILRLPKYKQTLHLTGKKQPLNEDLIFMKNIANKAAGAKGKRLFKKEEPLVSKEKSNETIYECELCSARLVIREAKEGQVN